MIKEAWVGDWMRAKTRCRGKDFQVWSNRCWGDVLCKVYGEMREAELEPYVRATYFLASRLRHRGAPHA